jgi:hypothetical protein
MRNPHNPSIFRQIGHVSDTKARNLRQNWKQREDLLNSDQHLAMLCNVDRVVMATWASGPERRIGRK